VSSQHQTLPAKKTAWRCPHCKSELRVRSSKSVSDLLRKQYLQCSDWECGATFTVSAEIDRQLSPSGKPDADATQIMDQLNARHQSRVERQTRSAGPFFGVSHAPRTKPSATTLDRGVKSERHDYISE